MVKYFNNNTIIRLGYGSSAPFTLEALMKNISLVKKIIFATNRANTNYLACWKLVIKNIISILGKKSYISKIIDYIDLKLINIYV